MAGTSRTPGRSHTRRGISSIVLCCTQFSFSAVLSAQKHQSLSNGSCSVDSVALTRDIMVIKSLGNRNRLSSGGVSHCGVDIKSVPTS